MNVRYRVELTQYERDELGALLSGGKHPARKLKRAQILLAADAGVSDEDIATSVGVGGSTVYRTKRRFVEGNLERALSEEPRPGAERKLTGKEEALLVATRLLEPAGGPRPLDAGAAGGGDGQVDRAREPVARDGAPTPGRERSQAVAQGHVVHSAGRCRVRRPHGGRARPLCRSRRDPKRPVVCFDESPIQLIGEVRRPIRAKPGQIERYDYEYRRNGTANLFVFLDVNRSWRKVKVTERRAGGRLRRLHARTRRCPLSQGGAHSRGARQPVDPFGRCALSDLPGCRSATAAAPIGVPLRP